MLGALRGALRRGDMDVRFRAGGRHVRLMERPGRWMSDADLAELSRQLRTVAAKTLPAGSLTYGVFSGDPQRMKNSLITLITTPDGRPVAFNALALMEVQQGPQVEEVLHLGLVMVYPNERSGGLSWVLYGLTCFLIFFRRQFRPIWVSNVTQVPAVVGMVTSMFSDIYPAPEGGRRSLSHLLLARGIMAHHRAVFGVGEEAGFSEETFVISNAYTGGSDDLKKTWEAAPKHRDDRVNRFCQSVLDYERGDDVLQLGRLDLPAITRYVAREVPKGAIPTLTLLAIKVALSRAILPLMHWADSRTQFGSLRPHDSRTP